MNKKILTLLLAGTLVLTVPMVTIATCKNDTQEHIISDGDITYFELKETIVQNFLYLYDISKSYESVQEAEDKYETDSFENLRVQIEKVENRLNEVNGPGTDLQIIECLNMQMDLTLAIQQLVIKGA